MPRLPGIHPRDAVRVFGKLGYRIVRQSGHLVMSNGKVRLVIPPPQSDQRDHHGPLARDAGLSPEQFRELL